MPVYFLEGNIGSGKTTLLKHIEDYVSSHVDTLARRNVKVHILYEPVDIWQSFGLLQRYYENPTRWGYTFQNIAFITKMMLLGKLSTEPNNYYIVERSPYSDRKCFAQTCYENGHISPMEMTAYDLWYNHYMPEFEAKHRIGYIYLQTSVGDCMTRINTRRRTEEDGIPRDYVANIHDKHETFMREVNVLRTKCPSPTNRQDKLKSIVIQGNSYSLETVSTPVETVIHTILSDFDRHNDSDHTYEDCVIR